MATQYPELDSRDIVAGFFPAFEAALSDAYAPRLGMLIGSDSETENYKWPGSAPGMREWLGGRHEEVLAKFSQSIVNSKYEDTMRIELDALRRDKTGFLRRRVAEMADAAAQHWDELLATHIETPGNSYDSQGFFDTDHDESGTNQLNLLAAAQIPAANVTTVAAPTADEASDIITQTLGHFYTITDDRGRPINGGMRDVEIMVNGSAYWAAVSRAISSDRLASGASNVVPTLGINLSVTLNPRLTSTSDAFMYFFRLDGQGGMRPFILQEEVPLQTQLKGAGSDFEFDNDAHSFGLKSVRAVGNGRWQHAMRVTLS